MNNSTLSNNSIISNALYNDLIAAFRRNMTFLNIKEIREIYERTCIMREETKTHFTFDVNEQTIIKAFIDDPPDKNDFLDKVIVKVSESNDEKINEIIIGIIKKVVNMTDEQFESIDLSEALDQSDFL